MHQGRSLIAICPMVRRGLTLAFLFLGVLAAGGCSTVGYYAQAVQGQAGLLWHSRLIENVLRDPSLPAQTRKRLALAGEIRHFASNDLGLPDNRSYMRYTDLGRPYVVWSVVAAPAFSVDPVTWCFPVAGCVPYRGYFDRFAAEGQGDRLKAAGYDVTVAGTQAYSTLGWLPDPLLNTMLGASDAGLAGLIFHELAHQQVYVSDDTTFNESFATLVELEGVRRWLAHSGRTDELEPFLAVGKRRDEVIELLLNYRRRLSELYASDLEPDVMIGRKSELFTALKLDYQKQRPAKGGDPGWDAWFKLPLNNAHLATVGAYYSLVPAFRRLFEQSNGDFTEFYRRVAAVAAGPPDQIRTRLGVAP